MGGGGGFHCHLAGPSSCMDALVVSTIACNIGIVVRSKRLHQEHANEYFHSHHRHD